MDGKSQPIYSTLADDPAAGEAIDAFVVELAERVDELQDLELRKELTQLSSRAAALGIDSAKVGFDALYRCAHAVESACLERSSGDARRALVELTELARRIRLGHRGAV